MYVRKQLNEQHSCALKDDDIGNIIYALDSRMYSTLELVAWSVDQPNLTYDKTLFVQACHKLMQCVEQRDSVIPHYPCQEMV
jgi:hypothetical protein